MFDDPVELAKAPFRVNIGCGLHPLPYWINLDEDPSAIADLHNHIPPLPFADNALEEVYAGHLLEHFEPDEADALLRDIHRVLRPGGRLGVVVPDSEEILTRWLHHAAGFIEYPAGTYQDVRDFNVVCRFFLYSTVQPSRHKWSYTMDTLADLLRRTGFQPTTPIDRMYDPRIPVGAWYQCGWDAVAVKP